MSWFACLRSASGLFFISAADGEYVSESLLVPDRCRFLHQEQMDTCKSYVYWHNLAKQVRTKCFCMLVITIFRCFNWELGFDDVIMVLKGVRPHFVGFPLEGFVCLQSH